MILKVGHASNFNDSEFFTLSDLLESNAWKHCKTSALVNKMPFIKISIVAHVESKE